MIMDGRFWRKADSSERCPLAVIGGVSDLLDRLAGSTTSGLTSDENF
jgi:hypothetical protein